MLFENNTVGLSHQVPNGLSPPALDWWQQSLGTTAHRTPKDAHARREPVTRGRGHTRRHTSSTPTSSARGGVATQRHSLAVTEDAWRAEDAWHGVDEVYELLAAPCEAHSHAELAALASVRALQAHTELCYLDDHGRLQLLEADISTDGTPVDER